MKRLFIVLACFNLAVFAWFQFGTGATDRSPLQRQIRPEQIDLTPPTSAASTTPPARTAAPPETNVLACLAWGSFASNEVEPSMRALFPLSLGDRVKPREVRPPSGWWVFIASQGSRQAALKKAAELKVFGIEDFTVLQDEGPYQFGIHLGAFTTQAEAQARLTRLRAQRVRSAQMGPHEAKPARTWFEIRLVDEPLAVRLRELVMGFPGTELRECAGLGE